MRWIITSYGLGLLTLVGVLSAVAALAAVIRFSFFQLMFLFVPMLTCYIVGRTYRHGTTVGAPRFRLLLLEFVLSGLILGTLSVYLGYGVISWILYLDQLGANPAFWQYLANPNEIRPLFLVHGQNEQNGIEVNLYFACALGAIIGLVAVAAGLRNPEAPGSSPTADPAGFLDHTVVDTNSSIGQRLAGLLLVILAGGALVLLWRAPGRAALAVPAAIVPAALVFGLGIMARPARPRSWIIVSILACAAGLLNCWLLLN